ncbi:MAG: hypothetical protein ACFFE8_13020 [Candidatus Heimdallarchaeota archaeon]
MLMQSDRDMIGVFKALSHPLRQQILLILSDRPSIGFTDLQNELNQDRNNSAVRVGSIYHHMKLLGNLVITGGGTWTLSAEGKFAVQLLTSSQDKSQFIKEEETHQLPFLSIILQVLAPPQIFFFARKSFILFLGWEILFLLLFSWITAQAHLVLFFVFFIDWPEQDLALSIASVSFSWVVFTILGLLLAKSYLKRKIKLSTDLGALLINMGIALLPLIVFPLVVILGIIVPDQPVISLTLVVILQLWVIILAARGVSVHFFVRMEQAGVLAMVAVYIMMSLGLVLGF